MRLFNKPLAYNTFHNKKVKDKDGTIFDSKAEAQRYFDLCCMQDEGLISDLEKQVSVIILEKTKRNRARKYIADFSYHENGLFVYEDVKSPYTKIQKVYTLKRDLVVSKLSDYQIFREYDCKTGEIRDY
jgi:hypothetical protein